jgi:subtilisin family serine protease
VSNLATAGDREFSGSGLAAAAQAWADGAANNGWILWQNSNDAWTVGSSENATVSYRPLLTVTYKPPVSTTTLTGAGVTVAVIDSGLFQDGGGSTRIKTTRDFTTGNSNPASRSPIDGYGHGTHVAGLIGERQGRGQRRGTRGQFVSLRVLNDSGSGSTSSVMMRSSGRSPTAQPMGSTC